MQPDNQQCTFGVNCRYLHQNRCFHFHPSWHHNQQSTQKPCFNGADCWYNKQGRCHFYHPPPNQLKSPSRIPNNNYPNQANGFTIIVNEELYLARKKRQEEQKRRKRQRQQEQAEIRRLQALRIVQMQNLIEANRMKSARKSNPQIFQWYFGKNKTFKAMEVSEEKLKELDQCVICYISFNGQHIDKNQAQEKKQNHENKTQQTIESIKHHPDQTLEKLQSKDERLITKQVNDQKEHLLKQLTQLYCKHTFHKECIKKWLSTTENCPICRKDFKDHKDYNKWEQQKKQLKPQKASLRLNNFWIDYQSPSSLLQRLQLGQFAQQMDSDDDDQMFVDEPDYADYEDGYDGQDMWDMDQDDF